MQPPIKLFTVASLLALSMTSAFAAQTTTMRVQGKIVTAGCTISMPNGDVSDFSNLTEADFDSPRIYFPNRSLIKSKQLAVTVNCPDTTFVAIKATDNNASSLPTDSNTYERLFHFDTINTDVPLANINWLGLGFASNGAPIGAYAVSLGTVSVDGNPQPSRLVGTGNGDWQQSIGFGVFFDSTHPYMTAGNSNFEPVAGKTFSFPLDIALNINPASALPVNQSLQFDASSTIEVVYL